MKKLDLRQTIVFPLFFCLGCTTLQVVEPTVLSASAEIEAGDRIEILSSSGEVYELTVISVSEMGILGESTQDREMLVSYENMAELQVRRIAPGRSIGLAAGIAAVILAIELRDFDPLGTRQRDSF